MKKALTHTDVFIVGAGPAGACAALNLAPFCRVTLIDRQAIPRPRAGESLPPAANKLLADMGLLASFKQQGHLPCFGNQSRWVGDHLEETDFLRDPQGHGWHLDRAGFDTWLRVAAMQRGARLVTPARLQAVEPQRDGWRVGIDDETGLREIGARVLIDAGGRTPVLAKRQGARRVPGDRLVCGWAMLRNGADVGRGTSYIEATPNGWWYTAPLPGERRILAFHADADDPDTAWLRRPDSLLTEARQSPGMAERMGNTRLLDGGWTAAHSAVTQPGAGPGWLAAGDAALSFDPLSSQGIFNAFYTGLAAAESTYRYLRGEITDFSEYRRRLGHIQTAYQRHLAQWYGEQRRWPESLFWQRRRFAASETTANRQSAV